MKKLAVLVLIPALATGVLAAQPRMSESERYEFVPQLQTEQSIEEQSPLASTPAARTMPTPRQMVGPQGFIAPGHPIGGEQVPLPQLPEDRPIQH